jgi:hypothetical protein
MSMVTRLIACWVTCVPGSSHERMQWLSVLHPLAEEVITIAACTRVKPDVLHCSF